MTTTGEPADTDLPEGLYITTFDVDKHAQAVADMWNASDANWPGTWTGGVPETAENVRISAGRQETIETFLCMDGDVVGGFCKVMPDLDEPGVDYVALVNVPPSHAKQGLARRLLQRAIALAVERDSSRLDLHTWSANLPAVPLYKKVGFMWMPDTDLHMLNFMPAVLRLDAARQFFATRDWYQVFRRDLDQVPDEDRWEDMKVFTYRFANSPDDPAEADPALVVRIDREARAICALETPEYAVAATASRLDPPRGGEVTLRWTLTNRGDAPLPVTVVATGNEELLISHRVSTELAPGATEVLEGTCRISQDAKDVKPGKPVPAVKSVLLVGDQVVELSTGLRPRPALEITTSPATITLVPGQRRKVQVRMRSRLEHAATVDLLASGAAGLDLDWNQRQLAVPAEGWAEAELDIGVPAGRSEAYHLSLSASCAVNGSTLRVEPEPRHVFAVAPGGLLAAREKESLRIENDHFRAVVSQRGGSFRLENPLSGEGLTAAGATVGPPFSPSEFRTLDYELDLRRSDTGLRAVATARSKRWPGFVFRCRFDFSASPVVELGAEVENGGTEARRVQVMQLANSGNGRRVLPFATGLTAGHEWADFPGADDTASKRPDKWAERWSATERRDGIVIGTVWAGELEEVTGGGAYLLTTAQPLEPQSRLVSEPMWIYCGPGRWQAVRDLWRRREGIEPPRDVPPDEPLESIRARVEPGPWIAGPNHGPVSLVIEHAATWPVDGTATLVAPEGWQLDRTEIDLTGATWQSPGRAEIEATPPSGDAPGAAVVRIRVRGAEFDRDLEVPVMAFTDSPAARVSVDRDEWRIDAGRSQVLVTPGHAGTTSSWTVDGVEQLASPYPETGSIGFLLPWHGGITPVLMMGNVAFPGRMWAEEFEASEVEEKDDHGLIWRGVKVTAESTHEDSRGMRLEASTLANAGAPVLKSVIRLTNSSGALQTPAFGSMVFCAPGGDRSNTRQFSAEGVATKHSERYVFHTSGTWVAAVNGDSGATLLMCSDRELEVAKFGTDGGHFLNLRDPRVGNDDTVESVSYLVAADNLEAALPWRALNQL